MATTNSTSPTLTMENKLNCSLDDLVKMQRQAAAKERATTRRGVYQSPGVRPSGRGRPINKRGGRGGGGLRPSPFSSRGGPVSRGTPRGRGGRFPGPATKRVTPRTPSGLPRKSEPAGTKASLAQRLSQPLENSIVRTTNITRPARPVGGVGIRGGRRGGSSVQLKFGGSAVPSFRGGLGSLGGRSRGRPPLALRRTRAGGAAVGRPAIRLSARPGIGSRARLRGPAAGVGTASRKMVAVRKTGIAKLVVPATRRANTSAMRLRAAQISASRQLSASANRRAQGARPRTRLTPASFRRTNRMTNRALPPAVQSNPVPVLRNGPVQEPVQRNTGPSPSDLELMSKIKIMATLDKVPPPMAAQRGVPVTPPQAMVEQHSYMGNGKTQGHLPYNGYSGGSLSDRFSKYGAR
ncbi:hypothetical protein CSUI_003055 [Cystoisospora suis]|uniref:Uncharacterized protein n=1 Tax=Cystoisospora suis TaxID=483139 RepID=A0A2C6L6L5_9APIC|nr:hypothetical protein CSUI_003055 [Cystoisospora suis]